MTKKPYTKSLETNLTKELRHEIKQLEEKYARALADYQNLEKRTQVQQGQILELVTAKTIAKFINILDDLQLAADHLKDPGLNLVLEQFLKVFESEGVVQLNHEHANFNPQEMECIDRVNGPKDQVITVAQKGYKIHDRLLRPSRVTVGNGQ